MFIIDNRKWFIGLSVVLVALAGTAILYFGIPLGVDFTGGTIIEVSYSGDRPAPESVETALADIFTSGVSLRTVGESGYVIRTPFLSEADQTEVLRALGDESTYTIERLSSVGPSIGAELRTKSLYAILLVILMVVLYVAVTFRKVSKPVSSWKYGLVAILALVHDVIVPAGVFALLAAFIGYEADVLFVTALLAILGFSVNDTIIVFDRIRENLRLNQEASRMEPFDTVVGRSLSQTFVRSLNTSLTAFFALLFIFLFAGPTIATFAATMLAGIVAGAYSSLFLAPPLLAVLSRDRQE